MDATNLQTARPHVSGVRWSGLQSEPEAVFTAYDRNAPEEVAKREAFAQSPRGKFLTAIQGIEQYPTFEPAADKLMGVSRRSLSDERAPLDTAALGACIAILTDVPGKAARDALDAIAEWLMQRAA